MPAWSAPSTRSSGSAFRREARDWIAELQEARAPTERVRVDPEAAAELLGPAGALWGLHVTELRPRAEFAALVAAGAYQAAATTMTWIAIRTAHPA